MLFASKLNSAQKVSAQSGARSIQVERYATRLSAVIGSMSCDAPIGGFLSTRCRSGPSARIISHLSGRIVGRGLFGKCKSSSAHGRTSRSASASVTWVIVCMMMTMISTAVVDLTVVMVVGVLIVAVVDVQ